MPVWVATHHDGGAGDERGGAGRRPAPPAPGQAAHPDDVAATPSPPRARARRRRAPPGRTSVHSDGAGAGDATTCDRTPTATGHVATVACGTTRRVTGSSAGQPGGGRARQRRRAVPPAASGPAGPARSPSASWCGWRPSSCSSAASSPRTTRCAASTRRGRRPACTSTSAAPVIFTVVLLSSSVTMHLSTMAADRGDRRRALRWLFVTFVLGRPSSSTSALEWAGNDFTMTDNAYGSIYYLLTGFHGLHLVGGLALMVGGRGRRERHRIARAPRPDVHHQRLLLALRRRRVDRRVPDDLRGAVTCASGAPPSPSSPPSVPPGCCSPCSGPAPRPRCAARRRRRPTSWPDGGSCT